MTAGKVGQSVASATPSAEDLQAKLTELEKQLRTRSRDAPKHAVVGALAGTALITTPLAVITVRRWWRWWNE